MKRCAIYTRKSTEEGLEQAFNSLDAQREACEAYIASQRHEGWKLVKTRFDDGGLSGGNLERPALQALLDEIDAGRFPGLYLLITGTQAFYEGAQGVHRKPGCR